MWFLDLFIGPLLTYLTWAVTRSFRISKSATWQEAKAKVSRVIFKDERFYGHVAEIHYEYSMNERQYSGVHKERFLRRDPGRRYAKQFTTRTELEIRVKPNEPQDSIVV